MSDNVLGLRIELEDPSDRECFCCRAKFPVAPSRQMIHIYPQGEADVLLCGVEHFEYYFRGVLDRQLGLQAGGEPVPETIEDIEATVPPAEPIDEDPDAAIQHALGVATGAVECVLELRPQVSGGVRKEVDKRLKKIRTLVLSGKVGGKQKRKLQNRYCRSQKERRLDVA